MVYLPAACAMSSHNVGFVNHLCWGGGASARVSSAALSDRNKFPLSLSWILMESRLDFSFLSESQVLFPEKGTQWHEKGAVGRQLLFDVSTTWQATWYLGRDLNLVTNSVAASFCNPVGV